MAEYVSYTWNKEKHPINKLALTRWLKGAEYFRYPKNR